MQLNHAIESKEDLLSHFSSSKQLEILDSEQMKNLLEMDAPPEVWEDASNRNLLSFNQQFVQQTKEFIFNMIKIEYCYLLSFLTNLTQLNLSGNKISDIFSISKLKNLKKINLGSNCIDDISVLLSFTDLIYLAELNLSQNQISDISSISKLKNLKILDLSCNNIEDISVLQSSRFNSLIFITNQNNFIHTSFAEFNRIITRLQQTYRQIWVITLTQIRDFKFVWIRNHRSTNYPSSATRFESIIFIVEQSQRNFISFQLRRFVKFKFRLQQIALKY
ncbi:leucine-rich_repeat domain-containing protein [Hexamita inflata]|uniref:Leucine-rich repeat domain-containing protein n=1 Tax=Hexamita inflata TaxID=28002 RepID=A0AA86N5Z5_9EUKA|nr:leucine-rich repeat domain-containing protein [Hexamita inflata]